MNELAPLPPGFELIPNDAPAPGPAAATPPLPPGFEMLPPGFVLENAPAASAPLPPPRPADLDTGMNVPETPATLGAQAAQVGAGEGSGQRKAIMYPKGTTLPAVPQGMYRMSTPRGTFDYDPKLITPQAIKRLSRDGRENEILGLGPVAKTDVPDPTVTVTERQPDGTEVKAAVGSPETAPAQAAALESGKLPGSTVQVETPLSTAMARVAKNPPLPPKRPDMYGPDEPFGPEQPQEFGPEQPLLPTQHVDALGFDVDPSAYENWKDKRPKNVGDTTHGMLTPREGETEQRARVEAAEAGLAEAQRQWDVAKARADLMKDKPTPNRGSPAFAERLAIENELAQAANAHGAAVKELSAARGAPAPTMTGIADKAATATQRVLSMPTELTNTVGILLDPVLGTNIRGAAKVEQDRLKKAFGDDPARQHELGHELASGVGSMIGFLFGGTVARGAGLTQKTGSMLIGGAQNAQESYEQAEKAGAEGWKKAAAFIAGGAVGATEGFGAGRLLDHLAGMDKATAGGVRRYLGFVLQQKGEEGLQEAVQSLGNDLLKLGILGIDPGDMTENAAKGAFLGVIIGGSTAALLGIGHLTNDPLKNALRDLIPDVPLWNGDEFGRATQGGAPVERAGQRTAPIPPQGPQAQTPEEVTRQNLASETPPPPPGFELEPGTDPAQTAPESGTGEGSASVPATSTPTVEQIDAAAADVYAAIDARRQARESGDEAAMAAAEARFKAAKDAQEALSESLRPAAEQAIAAQRLLRAAGYSDEDIADMSPPEREAAIAEARAEGVDPATAPSVSPAEPPVEQPAIPQASADGDTAAPPPALIEGETTTGTGNPDVDDVFGVPLDESLPEGQRPFIAEPAGPNQAGRRGEVIRVDSDGTWTVAWESGLITEVSPAYRAMYQTNAPKLPPPPGTRAAPVSVTTEADMEGVRSVVNTEPTEGQKAAGNYQKGHVRFEGLDISIENPKGSIRRGKDPDGTAWESELPGDYGDIKGTKGADGDAVDILIGPKGAVGAAYVVEQIDLKTGKFDEIKVITGVETRGEAVSLYEQMFSDGTGPQRWDAITPMSAADLKEWLIDKKGGRGPVPKRYRDKPQKKAEPKGEGWKLIGKNADGHPVYEDERGVRSFVESGVRVTESVGIIPGGGIVVKSPDERGSNYKTVEEQGAPATESDAEIGVTINEPTAPAFSTVDEAEEAITARLVAGGLSAADIDPEALNDAALLVVQDGVPIEDAYAQASIALIEREAKVKAKEAELAAARERKEAGKPKRPAAGETGKGDQGQPESGAASDRPDQAGEVSPAGEGAPDRAGDDAAPADSGAPGEVEVIAERRWPDRSFAAIEREDGKVHLSYEIAGVAGGNLSFGDTIADALPRAFQTLDSLTASKSFPDARRKTVAAVRAWLQEQADAQNPPAAPVTDEAAEAAPDDTAKRVRARLFNTKAFRKAVAEWRAANQGQTFDYPHPESEVAAAMLDGYEDAKAGKKPDPEHRHNQPFTPDGDGTFDPLNGYRTGYTFGRDGVIEQEPSSENAAWLASFDETPAPAAPTKSTAEDAVDSMFDELLAPETAQEPEAEPEPKAKPARAPKAKPPRTAGEAATSAVKNVGMSLEQAGEGLMTLFGAKDKGRLGSGPTFDPETYEQAKPFFKAAVSHLKAAAQDLKAVAGALIRYLQSKKMPDADIRAMRPYLVRFVSDVENGNIVLEGDADGPATGPVDQAGEQPDSPRVPKRRGGRGKAGGQLEGAAPEDGGEPGPADAPAGARPDGQDAERPEGERGGGDAADGRPGTGGEGLAADGAGERGRRPASTRPNYHIADPERLVGGTPKVRFARNRAAIEAYRAITEEGRDPTQDELDAMAAYIGWGSFGQELFQGTWDRPKVRDDWRNEDAWLREHLGKEEWESAQRSIINAHYTDPPTVNAMWDMLRQMGFKGGRVLEPSMGVGNFFGMMPRDLMDKSDLTGIELDGLTGGMAKILYPQANVQIKGYEQSKTPDNFYDVVIGNWPFANVPVADRRYSNLSPSLHDYFFVKALDQVRPGGIVIGITSAGTMDKQATTIRTHLAKGAELVAAFRLPSGAFEKYAGTSVVTDIVILRKRETPLHSVLGLSAQEQAWIGTEEIDTPAGEKIRVNSYFANNRSKVLGTLNFGSGTTYGRAAMIVDRPADLMERLQALAATLPADAFAPIKRGKEARFITNNTKDRDGAIVRVEKGGKDKPGFYIVQGERLVAMEDLVKYRLKDPAATAKRESQFASLINIRRAYGALIDAERAGDPDTEIKRGTLKRWYDEFRKAHGTIGGSDGLKFFIKAGDPFAASLEALERPDGSPSRVLTEPTVRSIKKLENPTVRDAFVLTRNEGLVVDLDKVAELAKKPVADVERELLGSGAIYRTPGGGYEVADVYLSGNVRRKLREALAAQEEGETGLDDTVAALRGVLPKDVPYFQIEAQLGATWVPNDDYRAFIAEMLGVPASDAIDVKFSAGSWKVRFSNRSYNQRPEAQATWGYDRYNFDKLLTAAMNNQSIKIFDATQDGPVFNETASKEANEKATRVREEFKAWAWRDPERRVRFEKDYNEVMNAMAEPRFDGAFLEFPGMALRRGDDPFSLRKHQIDAIWRGVANGRGLFAHEVGTGKTYTMGGIAVESRRYGVARKPMIFAHNANSASVAREIQEMYPGAKVLYVDNLSPDKINTTLRRIANDEWDAIVIPHSVADRLALKEETLMAIAAEQIAALEEEAVAAAAEDPNSGGLTIEMVQDMQEGDAAYKRLRSPTAKNLVKQRLRIIAKIQELGQRASREGAIAFEDLGVDMIIIDEAHEFKKPPIATKMQMKGLNTATSDRSIALKFLTDYVKSLRGGKGVHVFTGTPITNTLTEIYNMQRFVMEDQMKKDGISEWDPWFNTFASVSTDVELTATGEYEPVTRLASFVNVAELRRMIGQYMDIVFADDMPEFKPRPTSTGKTIADKTLTDSERAELMDGRMEKPVGRPYKRVINDVGPMGEQQQAVLDELADRANQFKKASRKERRDWMLAGDNRVPIRVETDAANASLDVRLYDMDGEDHPESKENRTVRNVLKHYNEHAKSTQVIFLERGFSDASTKTEKVGSGDNVQKITVKIDRFNLVKSMVDKLVAGGIPREQIAVVDGKVSKEKRKEIADKMNRAEIRVAIGNSQTLGVGVNMQENLRSMHHMDAPWMPGLLEQRNGRGHRQGNKWNTVLEYRYITDKLDGRRWQVLAVKDRFIKAFLKADESIRVIEGEAVEDGESGDDLAKTLADAAGDPRLLMVNKIKGDIARLEGRERLHSFGIYDARERAKKTETEIDYIEKAIASYEADHAGWEAVRGPEGKNFVVKIGRQTYEGSTPEDRKAAQQALDDFLTKSGDIAKGEAVRRPAGVSINGVAIAYHWPEWNEQPQFVGTTHTSKMEYKLGALSLGSVDSVMRGLPKRAEDGRAEIADKRQSITRMEDAAKQPFQQAELLEKKRKQLVDLENDIQANPSPPPAWLRTGAPTDTLIYVDGKERVVTGHKWADDGYFILTDEGPVSYLDAKDALGVPLYEAKAFAAPTVNEDVAASMIDLPAGWYAQQASRSDGAPQGQTWLVRDGSEDYMRGPVVAFGRSEADAILQAKKVLYARRKAEREAAAQQTPDAPGRAMAAPRLTPRAEAAGLSDRAIKEQLVAIVRQVAGTRPNVAFTDGASVMVGNVEAAGGWFSGQRLVVVAMGARNPEGVETAYHEAFHALQTFGAFTEQEIAVLEREAPRHRAMLHARWIRESGRPPHVDLPVGETSAYTFGMYAAARAAGQPMTHLHIAVRRAFDKGMEILRRLRNWLNGLGFQTSEDIYARAFEGHYAGMGNMARSWDQPAASARLWNETPGGRAMAAPPMRKQRDRSIASKASESWLDRFVRLMELENDFRRDSGAQPVQVHRAIGALNTQIADATEDMRDDELTPAVEAAARLELDDATVQALRAINPDIDLSDGERIIHRFTFVRHAPDYNDYIANKNVKMQDAGSGITTAQANAEWAIFQQDSHYNELLAAAQLIYDMTNRDLAERVAAGLMSQQTALDMRQAFPHYVPLRGFEHDDFEPGGRLSGVGISMTRSESPSGMGRTSAADSILTQTALLRKDGIVRARKNRIDVALLRLAQQMEAHYGASSPLKAPRKVPMVRVESGGQVVEIPDSRFGERPNVIVAKINGKRRYVVFDGELDLVRELKNAVIQRDDFSIRLLGQGTSFLGSLWTWRYPLFAPVNFVRDYMDASTAAMALLGPRGLAAYQANLASTHSLRQAFAYQIGRESPEFARFRRAGGRMSWAALTDEDSIDKEIAEILNGVPVWKQALRLPFRVLVTGLNDVLENTHRYALYKAALDIGLPEAQAVKVALEGTMNFHRRGSGEGARWARTIYPFFNPSVQAPMRSKRLIEEAGGFRTSRGKLTAALIFAKGLGKTYFAFQVFGFIVGMVNYIVGGEDDEGNPWWDKAQWNPQSYKNIMIYTGGKDAKGEPNVAMIPAFPEIMLPFHMGNALAASIMGKMSAKNIALTVGKAAAHLSPTEGRGFAPSIIQPFAEVLWANKNHFGSPIHPQEYPGSKGIPKPERKFASTDEKWQQVARAFGGFGVNLHPEDYRHLARSYAAGYYQLAEWGASLAGVSVSERGDPLTRRFYTPGERAHAPYDRTMFDEAQGKANAAREALKRKYEDPTIADPAERRRKNAEVAEKVEAEGGVIGGRNGITTPQAQIFDGGRAIMSAQAKKREAEIARVETEAERAALRKAWGDRIADTRKTVQRLSNDLASGKISADAATDRIKDMRDALKD
jgi:N12 class adenine-specific DNA methylase